jgi:nucleotidyltransferase/DNA polymerase involved in DNA repair
MRLQNALGSTLENPRTGAVSHLRFHKESRFAMSKRFLRHSFRTVGRHFIRSCGERLRSDGIDTIRDQWDLAEEQDKYAFMEKIVTR